MPKSVTPIMPLNTATPRATRISAPAPWGKSLELPSAARNVALNVVPFRGCAARFGRLLRSPLPAADCRHVVAMLVNVLLVLDQPLVDRLLEVGCAGAQLG